MTDSTTLELNRVSSAKLDVLIRPDEWLLYAEDEKDKVKNMLNGTTWISNLTQQLNEEETNTNIERRIHNRTRITSDLNYLISFAKRSFITDEQQILFDWIKKSHKQSPIVLLENPENDIERRCLFTNLKPTTLLQIQFQSLNNENNQRIEDSPKFYCSEEYALVINSLSIILRFEFYAYRIVQQKMEAKTEASHKQANIEENLLQAAINGAARYIFVFFLDRREKKAPCKCSILNFNVYDNQ